MYLLINKTERKVTKYEGDYPVHIINALLDKGDDIIIISLYSNTIKIPFSNEEYNETVWDTKEYSFPSELVNPAFMLKHSTQTKEFAIDILNNKLRRNEITTSEYLTQRENIKGH